MKKLAFLLAMMFVLACCTRSVLGMGGEIPPGERIAQHADWPEGMADVLNKFERVGGFWHDYWVSDGLINASEHYYYQGDSDAFNAFLEGMARLKGAPLTVVLLEGIGKATGWWAKDPDKGPEADWMISVLPTGGAKAPDAPKDKPGCVLIVNAWLGGQIDEANLKIPRGMKAIFASKIKLSIRCAANDLKVGDKIPVEFTVTNGGKSEFDYQDYGESAEHGNGMWLEAKTGDGTVPAWPNIGDMESEPPRSMQLAPAKSFTKTLVLNRLALVNAPGRFVVTGSYRLPGGFGVVTSKPITVEVQQRTPPEMTAYVDGLVARLNALKGDEGRVGLMRQLTYTGDMRVLPALIDSMYKTKARFCEELWFNPYLPDKAEIKRQVIAAATKRGLANGMTFFLQGAKISPVEMCPLIERSLAEDNPGCWEEGCGAAQCVTDTRFVPRLIAIAGAPDTNANMTAMRALVVNRTDEGVAALRKLLKGRDERLKKLAAEVIGPEPKEVVPGLIKALGDPKAEVRSGATDALGDIGPEAKEAVPALIEALGDPNAVVRWNAVNALGRIGPGAKDAVPALIKALGDPDVDLRYRAARALGRIGPGAKEAIPELERLAEKAPNEENEWVRRDAREALEKIRR